MCFLQPDPGRGPRADPGQPLLRHIGRLPDVEDVEREVLRGERQRPFGVAFTPVGEQAGRQARDEGAGPEQMVADVRIEEQHGEAAWSREHAGLTRRRFGRGQGLVQKAEQAPFQSRLVQFRAHTVHVSFELIQFAVFDLGEECLDHRLEARAGFRQVDNLAVVRRRGLLLDPANQV